MSQFQQLADNPDAVQAAIDYAEDNDTIATRTIALMKIKQAERTDILENSTKSSPIDTKKEIAKAADICSRHFCQRDHRALHAKA